MTIKTGQIVKYRKGTLLEVRPNGTYINFNNEVWKDAANKAFEDDRIVAVYQQVQK